VITIYRSHAITDCHNDKIRDEYNLDGFLPNDPNWDKGVQEILRRCIVDEGATPKAAAVQAGLSINTFKTWMGYPDFSDWIVGLQQRHFSLQRKNIVDSIDQIEDPKDSAEKTIKYLEHIDPEFSTKRIMDIKQTKEGEDDNWANDPELQNVLDEAERAKDSDPGE
jgi:hypothetical protein